MIILSVFIIICLSITTPYHVKQALQVDSIHWIWVAINVVLIANFANIIASHMAAAA